LDGEYYYDNSNSTLATYRPNQHDDNDSTTIGHDTYAHNNNTTTSMVVAINGMRDMEWAKQKQKNDWIQRGYG